MLKRINYDGINSIEYKIENKTKKALFTHFKVSYDKNKIQKYKKNEPDYFQKLFLFLKKYFLNFLL